MDQMNAMKERSYKIVESMRLKNQRENRKLESRLYSKQGMRAAYINEVGAISQEQERIRRELVAVRQTMTTTWGNLPGRSSQDSFSPRMELDYILRGAMGRVHKKKKKRPVRAPPIEETYKSVTTPPTEVQKDEETEVKDEKFHLPQIAPENPQSIPEIKLQEEWKPEPTRLETLPDIPGIPEKTASDTRSKMKPNNKRRPKLTPIDETGLEVENELRMSMPDIDDNVSEAASFSSSISRVSKQKRKKRKDISPDQFDSKVYNSDGTMRTMHMMPSMATRTAEARKARYIRHKETPATDVELSINEMLADIKRENSFMSYPVRTH